MSTSSSTESNTAMQLLGSDPWIRHDLWTARAWDAAEKAALIAAEIGPTTNSNDDLDHRIVTLFHAAGLAERFAAMVNPLFSCTGHVTERSDAETEEIEISMFLDTDGD